MSDEPQTPSIESSATPTNVPRRSVVEPTPSDPDGSWTYGRRHAKRARRHRWFIQRLPIWFAGAIALAGLLNFAASGVQWYTMQNQLATANRQADVAEKALTLSRRPWLGVDTIEVLSTHGDVPSHFQVRITNSGQGPAIDAVASLEMRIWPVQQTPVMPSRPCGQCGHYLMMPDTAFLMVQNYGEIMTDQLAQLVKSSQMVIWIFGWIDYRDEFGQSHTTEVCYRYLPASSDFGACISGNNGN